MAEDNPTDVLAAIEYYNSLANPNTSPLNSLGANLPQEEGTNTSSLFNVENYEPTQDVKTVQLKQGFFDEVGAGVEAGAIGIGESFDYFKALGNTLLGDEQGVEVNLQQAASKQAAASVALKDSQSFEDFINDEDKTLDDILGQTGKGFGLVLPSIAGSVAAFVVGGLTGGAGAAAAPAIASAAFSSASRAFIKKAVKDAINKKIKKQTLTSAEEDLLKVGLKIARKNKLWSKKGGFAGQVAYNYPIHSGSSFSEFKEGGEDLTTERAFQSLLIGAPLAALDITGERVILGSLNKLLKQTVAKTGQTSFTRQLAKDIAKATGKGALVEAPTEALQETGLVLQRMSIDDTYTKEQAKLRIAEGAWLGLLGGGSAGAVGGSAISSAKQVFNYSDTILKQKADSLATAQLNNSTTGVNDGFAATQESVKTVDAQINEATSATGGKNIAWIADSNIDYYKANNGKYSSKTGFNTAKANPREVVQFEASGRAGNGDYITYIPGEGYAISKSKGAVNRVSKTHITELQERLASELGFSGVKPPTANAVVVVRNKEGLSLREEAVDANDNKAVTAAIAEAKKAYPNSDPQIESIEQSLEKRKAEVVAEQNQKFPEDADTFGDPSGLTVPPNTTEEQAKEYSDQQDMFEQQEKDRKTAEDNQVFQQEFLDPPVYSKGQATSNPDAIIDAKTLAKKKVIEQLSKVVGVQSATKFVEETIQIFSNPIDGDAPTELKAGVMQALVEAYKEAKTGKRMSDTVDPTVGQSKKAAAGTETGATVNNPVLAEEDVEGLKTTNQGLTVDDKTAEIILLLNAATGDGLSAELLETVKLFPPSVRVFNQERHLKYTNNDAILTFGRNKENGYALTTSSNIEGFDALYEKLIESNKNFSVEEKEGFARLKGFMSVSALTVLSDTKKAYPDYYLSIDPMEVSFNKVKLVISTIVPFIGAEALPVFVDPSNPRETITGVESFVQQFVASKIKNTKPQTLKAIEKTSSFVLRGKDSNGKEWQVPLSLGRIYQIGNVILDKQQKLATDNPYSNFDYTQTSFIEGVGALAISGYQVVGVEPNTNEEVELSGNWNNMFSRFGVPFSIPVRYKNSKKQLLLNKIIEAKANIVRPAGKQPAITLKNVLTQPPKGIVSRATPSERMQKNSTKTLRLAQFAGAIRALYKSSDSYKTKAGLTAKDKSSVEYRVAKSLQPDKNINIDKIEQVEAYINEKSLEELNKAIEQQKDILQKYEELVDIPFTATRYPSGGIPLIDLQKNKNTQEVYEVSLFKPLVAKDRKRFLDKTKEANSKVKEYLEESNTEKVDTSESLLVLKEGFEALSQFYGESSILLRDTRDIEIETYSKEKNGFATVISEKSKTDADIAKEFKKLREKDELEYAKSSSTAQQSGRKERSATSKDERDQFFDAESVSSDTQGVRDFLSKYILSVKKLYKLNNEAVFATTEILKNNAELIRFVKKLIPRDGFNKNNELLNSKASLDSKGTPLVKRKQGIETGIDESPTIADQMYQELISAAVNYLKQTKLDSDTDAISYPTFIAQATQQIKNKYAQQLSQTPGFIKPGNINPQSSMPQLYDTSKMLQPILLNTEIKSKNIAGLINDIGHEYGHLVLEQEKNQFKLPEDQLTPRQRGIKRKLWELYKIDRQAYIDKFTPKTSGIGSYTNTPESSKQVEGQYSLDELGFDEWYADKSGATFKGLIASSDTSKPYLPKTLVDRYFYGIAKKLKAIMLTTLKAIGTYRNLGLKNVASVSGGVTSSGAVRSTANKEFSRIFIKEVLNKQTQNTKRQEVSLDNYIPTEAYFDVDDIVYSIGQAVPKKAVKNLWKGAQRVFGDASNSNAYKNTLKVASTVNHYFEQFGEAGKKLARFFNAPSNSRTKSGFHNLKARQEKIFINEIEDTLGIQIQDWGNPEYAELGRVIEDESINTVDLPTDAQLGIPFAKGDPSGSRSRAREVREFYQEVYKNYINPVLSIGQSKNYFSRQWNISSLARLYDNSITDPNAKKAVDLVIDEIALVKDSKGKPYGKLVATSIFKDMVSKYSMEDSTIVSTNPDDAVPSPGAPASLVRALGAIPTKRLREIEKDTGTELLYSWDKAIIPYFHHMTRKVEFEKLGGTKELQKILTEIVDSEHPFIGTASLAEQQETILQRARLKSKLQSMIDGQLGRVGKEVPGLLSAVLPNKVVEKLPNTLAQINGAAAVFTVSTTLLFTTFSSFTDFAGIPIRAKTFKNLTSFLSDLKRGDYALYKQLARDVGAISNEAMDTVFISVGELDYNSQWSRTALEQWFKYTGLTWLTRTSRIYAVGMAQAYIKNTYADYLALKQKADAKTITPLESIELNKNLRWLKELELTPSNVEEFLKNPDINDPNNKAISVAISRFSDEAIIRPNPSTRPNYANSPYFAIVFQLKTYFYAYGAVVLGGLGREMGSQVKEGKTFSGPASLLFLASMTALPLAALGIESREWSKYIMRSVIPGLEADGRIFRSDYMDTSEYLMLLIDRAGALGPFTLLLAAAHGMQYGDNPALSFVPIADAIDRSFVEGDYSRLVPVLNNL